MQVANKSRLGGSLVLTQGANQKEPELSGFDDPRPV